MKHRKIIRLLVIPAALFVILLIVLVMCRRSAICGETYSDRANYAKTLGYSISADSETVQNIVIRQRIRKLQRPAKAVRL